LVFRNSKDQPPQSGGVDESAHYPLATVAPTARSIPAKSRGPNSDEERDIHGNQIYESGTYDKPDGSKGQLVSVVRNDIRIGARFSFLRVTDRGSYRHHDAAGIPYRSEELVEFLECYGEILDRVEEQGRKLPKGSRDLTEEQFRAIALSVIKDIRRRRHEPYPTEGIPRGTTLSRV
jgi:hypothetical protein